MWVVTAVADGERRELSTRVIESEEPPSLEQVREAAADFPRAQRLVRYIDAELRFTQDDRRSVRSFDAVQRWSARAADESREFAASRGRFVSLTDADAALGYFSSPATRNPEYPDSVVWHAHSIVVVSLPTGVDHVELEYRLEPRDAIRLEWLTARFRTPAHTVETILDARTCRGSDSELIDHFRRMRARGLGFVTSIRGTADVLVGRILHRVTASEPAPLEDPTYQPRRAAMEQRWPGVSRTCPDIRSLPSHQDHELAMVLIHGTVSCGIQALKDLFPQGQPPFPVYRFEHDTFLRVSANGRELARLIAIFINAKRLLLVAHSRGGLVGRATLTALQKLGDTADTHLLTFGTPHEGTPLVKVAKGLLNLLLKVGSQIVDGIPLMTPVVAAFSHVYDVSSLPEGIAIMEDRSETLDLFNGTPPPPQVRCWGSVFNPDQSESGFGFDVENVLTGVMGRDPHDLVVPLRSALAWGHREPALNCSHVGYFAQPAVKAAILSASIEPPDSPGPQEARTDESRPPDIVPKASKPLRLDFHYHLDDHSRLPLWFTLPPGTQRSDVSVSLHYSVDRLSATMKLVGSGGDRQSVICEVHEIVDDSNPTGHPRRELLKAVPEMFEVIEYSAPGPIFHVVEEAFPARIALEKMLKSQGAGS